MTFIYKIIPRDLWRATEINGVFHGSEADQRDGFIHFSTGDQVAGTAAKHFSGRDDLLLFAVDDSQLGAALKWEPSRGDALFPHLYAPLTINDVSWVKPLPLSKDGPANQHILPELK